jgi:hypothetical protein
MNNEHRRYWFNAKLSGAEIFQFIKNAKRVLTGHFGNG